MSELLKRKLSVLKKNPKLLIISGLFYLSGIIVGVICFYSKKGDGVFFKQVYNYYNRIFDPKISPLSTLFLRFIVNIGYIGVIFALSFTVFTYPIILLLIAYRGAIIGCIAGIFIKEYGFSGGALFFFVTLPQNVLVTLGLIVSAVLNFDYVINKCCKKTDVSVLLTNCIIGLGISFLGAIYELTVSVIIIRPMNFYF